MRGMVTYPLPEPECETAAEQSSRPSDLKRLETKLMSSLTCPNCGWLNRATNRFCSNCGTAIVPSDPAPTEAVPSSSPAPDAAPVVESATSAAPAPEVETPAASAASEAPTSAFTPPPASKWDTQPVTYAVKRWEGAPTEVETSQGFTPPAPPSGSSAPTIPIAPPPVPPGSYPYGSEANTVSVGTNSNTSSGSLPQRGDGATYVPYSPDAARHLEANNKNSQSWLIPAIVVGALLLLIVGSVGGFLIFNGQKPTNSAASPTSTPSQQAQLPPSGQCAAQVSKLAGTTEENALRAIICQSNDEQIQAWHDLDTEILKGTRTGQALTENIQAVQDLRDKSMYAVPNNKSIEFGDVFISDDTATAKTTEVWTVVFYSKNDNKTVLSQGPDTLHEIYHFVKVEGKWLISSVDILQDTPPATPSTSDT